MKAILFPSTASNQGFAFEDLILSSYHQSEPYTVCAWSTYLHGISGTWYQCDGIVEDKQGRYLIEAKCFRDRPAKASDINPERRQQAAFDLGCTGIHYISLNGFDDTMLSSPTPTNLTIQFFSWSDIRDTILANIHQQTSVLLDPLTLTPTQAITPTGTILNFDHVVPIPFSAAFPEFITLPDRLEMWIKRMPRLQWVKDQWFHGDFVYEDQHKTVRLIPARTHHISLQEAWDIQDAFSGYAGRTYNAVRATAEVLSSMTNGLLDDVQSGLHIQGWQTGKAGVRDSLTFLQQLQLVSSWREGNKSRYALTPLGKAYTPGGTADDTFFAQVVYQWLPYRALRQALVVQAIPAKSTDIIAYFKQQYAPYEPYARSLFNLNKTEGLLKLYHQFG
jgi:hypothetical protein